MSLRRSTRTQPSRVQRYPEDHGHAEGYATQANEVAMGMMGLGGMGHHPQVSGDMGHYNQNVGHHGYHHYGQNQYVYHQQHQQQHQQFQYPHTHHGYVHHSAETSQENYSSMSAPFGRTLRARNTVNTTVTAPASSTTASPHHTHSGHSHSTTRSRRAPTASSSHHQNPLTSGGTDAGMDSDDDDWMDVDDVAASTADGVSSSKASKTQQNQGMDTTLTVDQMVQNCFFYLLLMQNKKVPVKKWDLIKHAMNSQHLQFEEVMKKLEANLDNVFGMRLVRLEKGKDKNNTIVVANPPPPTSTDEQPGSSTDKKVGRKGGSSESYILVSKYPSSVCDSVSMRNLAVDSMKTVLYLVLATIFMLNKAVDEEVIWKIIVEMQMEQMVCKKRSDLRKFLKSEFVSSGYLNIELSNQTNLPGMAKYSENASVTTPGDKSLEDEVNSAKYLWGPRAHVEYSKYSMLKFVANRFPGKRPLDFTVQYGMLSKEEKALAEKELLSDGRAKESPTATDAENTSATGENGSAIHIKQKKGGKGETYTIDGDNTETETEVE